MEPAVRRALEEARRGVERNPRSAKAWRSLGAVLDAHQLFANAEACYRQALALGGDDFRCIYWLALMLYQQGGKIQESETLMRRASEMQPNYPAVFYRLGEFLDRSGKRQDARKAYADALRLDPNLAIAHQNLGQVLLDLGESANAVQHLERAIELGDKNRRCSAALAKGYRRLGDLERATEAARDAARIQRVLSLPDPIRLEVKSLEMGSLACQKRANEAMRNGDYAAATSDLEIVAEALPDNARVQLSLATCYSQTGQPTQAEENFGRALAIRSEMALAAGSTAAPSGALLKLDGEISQYRSHYRALSQPVAQLVQRATALARSGNLEASLAAFQNAAAMGLLDASAHLDWGTVLGNDAQFESALEHFQEAVRLDPGNAGARYSLGLVLERLDRREEAVAQYRFAVRLVPGHAAAKRLSEIEAPAD